LESSKENLTIERLEQPDENGHKSFEKKTSPDKKILDFVPQCGYKGGAFEKGILQCSGIPV
jgi:hypothetical protein